MYIYTGPHSWWYTQNVAFRLLSTHKVKKLGCHVEGLFLVYLLVIHMMRFFDFGDLNVKVGVIILPFWRLFRTGPIKHQNKNSKIVRKTNNNHSSYGSNGYIIRFWNRFKPHPFPFQTTSVQNHVRFLFSFIAIASYNQALNQISKDVSYVRFYVRFRIETENEAANHDENLVTSWNQVFESTSCTICTIFYEANASDAVKMHPLSLFCFFRNHFLFS